MRANEDAIGFLLTEGGAFHRLLVGLGGHVHSSWSVARVAMLVGAVAWVPLFAISLADGHAIGGPGSLVHDVGVHARLLLALPLALWAELPITRRFDEAVRHLADAALIDDENRPAVLASIRRAERLRDLFGADTVFAIAGLGVSVMDILNASHGPRTWVFPTTEHLSTAGFAYLAFSAPLFRFVVLRWAWRLAIWTVLLVTLARSRLRINPAHPDGNGGLSVLSEAHTSFGWVVLALSISLAGNLTTQKYLLDRSFPDYQNDVVSFVVLAPLLFLLPLFAFSWPLERARRRYHREYGSAAADFAMRYAKGWIDPASREPLPLGTSETSAHTDLVTSFEHVGRTHVIPFTVLSYLTLLAAALGPMLALAMQDVPLVVILTRVKDAIG